MFAPKFGEFKSEHGDFNMTQSNLRPTGIDGIMRFDFFDRIRFSRFIYHRPFCPLRLRALCFVQPRRFRCDNCLAESLRLPS